LELSEPDAMTMEQITTEQAGLQKQLDQTRKATKQHGNLVQVSSSFCLEKKAIISVGCSVS
jgi:hypothetical protein